MNTQQSDELIGPSSTPPPFARTHSPDRRGERGALPTATWRPLIGQVCAAWGVDPIRVEAMMLLESAGQDLDPNDAGAVGLMQIIPEVWPELCAAVCRAHGAPNAMGSWRRPEINVEIGARELKWWIEEECGGDADGGSCAYFSGHCVPNGAADSFGTTDRDYVAVVRRNMDRVRQDVGGPPPTPFAAGDRIAVADGPLRRRDAPGLAASILDELPTGTPLCVTAGPETADGHTWYQVTAADGGNPGWVAGEFCHLLEAGGCS